MLAEYCLWIASRNSNCPATLLSIWQFYLCVEGQLSCPNSPQSTITCASTQHCWETAFLESIRRFINSTMQLHLGLIDSYERFPQRRRSPSWELPNAGSKLGPPWWSRNAGPARH